MAADAGTRTSGSQPAARIRVRRGAARAKSSAVSGARPDSSGDRVTAFEVPGTDVELMLTASETAGPPGFMLAVDDVDVSAGEHPSLPPPRDPYAIPEGQAPEYDDPDGHLFGVRDERESEGSDFEAVAASVFQPFAQVRRVRGNTAAVTAIHDRRRGQVTQRQLVVEEWTRDSEGQGQLRSETTWNESA